MHGCRQGSCYGAMHFCVCSAVPCAMSLVCIISLLWHCCVYFPCAVTLLCALFMCLLLPKPGLLWPTSHSPASYGSPVLGLRAGSTCRTPAGPCGTVSYVCALTPSSLKGQHTPKHSLSNQCPAAQALRNLSTSPGAWAMRFYRFLYSPKVLVSFILGVDPGYFLTPSYCLLPVLTFCLYTVFQELYLPWHQPVRLQFLSAAIGIISILSGLIAFYCVNCVPNDVIVQWCNLRWCHCFLLFPIQ